MGILRDFEQRLEGAVEGFFARAFRSGLQPVELAKALQRYAANYQQVGLDGVFVPNVYRFSLAPDDLERFGGIEASLRHELADVVRRTAADRGWRLKGPVRIELRRDENVRVGTYELRGKAEAEQQRQPPAPRPQAPAAAPVAVRPEAVDSSTQVMPRPSTAKATLRVVAGTSAGREHAVEGTAVLGRLPECEVTIDDVSVSRRHAKIARGNGQWTIEDLGSTNGVKVNGSPVGRATLSDGDEVELGSVRLAFRAGG